MRTNDARLIELVAGHHMLATTALARAAGLSAGQWRRLRRDDVWLPVVPGLWRHAATPLTWEMKVRAGAAWLGKEAALYGPTAARWWNIDGCDSDSVEFVVPRARRHLTPWLTLHTTTLWRKGDVLHHRAGLDARHLRGAQYVLAAHGRACRRQLQRVPCERQLQQHADHLLRVPLGRLQFGQ